jgi:hypothetical protein
MKAQRKPNARQHRVTPAMRRELHAWVQAIDTVIRRRIAAREAAGVKA